MGEFRMPSLGADMDAGTLVEWRVAAGEHVSRGDIVAVVDTDKATIDVEVFETGVVDELLVEPGERVPVGTPLARIAAAGSEAPRVPQPDRPPPVSAPVRPTPSRPPEQPANGPATPVTGGPGRHRASVVLSPVVRHLAERLGVDPTRVQGSGVGHRVTRADVEAAAARRISPRARRLAAERGVDLDALSGAGSGPGGAVIAGDVPAGGQVATDREPDRDPGQVMARMMERSNREIPHFHLASTIDLEPALAWLDALNVDRPAAERVLPAALLVRAAARAARAVPGLNGWWEEGRMVRAEDVTVGMVVSLRGGGLATPSLVDPDLDELDAVMDRLRGAVERARRGSLRSSDMAPASITVTNLGDRGAEVVHGVIQPPQVALVGFGRIVERPWVVDGRIVPRRVVVASLAADHRAGDGHSGSRYLSHLAKYLDPGSFPHDDSPGGDHAA